MLNSSCRITSVTFIHALYLGYKEKMPLAHIKSLEEFIILNLWIIAIFYIHNGKIYSATIDMKYWHGRKRSKNYTVSCFLVPHSDLIPRGIK